MKLEPDGNSMTLREVWAWSCSFYMYICIFMYMYIYIYIYVPLWFQQWIAIEGGCWRSSAPFWLPLGVYKYRWLIFYVYIHKNGLHGPLWVSSRHVFFLKACFYILSPTISCSLICMQCLEEFCSPGQRLFQRTLTTFPLFGRASHKSIQIMIDLQGALYYFRESSRAALI